MKCLILAAGRGSRLPHKKPKPLIEILGVPLIERVIRTAVDSGVDEFYIVLGNKADIISSYLSRLSENLKIKIKIIFNENWSSFDNGFSVLKAKKYLKEPFLLLMADHIVDKEILEKILKSQPEKDEILLAVDIRKENPHVDIEEATKVIVENNFVKDIGKSLINYNGFDTGVFYCSPIIFEAVEEALKENKSKLSDAIKILAKKNKVKAVEIDEGFWIDIDNEKCIKKVENYLLKRLNSKINDGIISKKLNRPISIKISKFLLKFNVTPNQISIISFLISCLAAYLFSFKSYFGLFFGGILAQLSSIIDGCDGEVARLKYKSTKFGAWLDAILDRYSDAFLIWGLIWHELTKNAFFWGILALIGTFLVSYTADKYDNLMKEKIYNSTIRIGRDLRVFIIFVGAILNQVILTLAILGILMNIEVVRRIWICRE